MVEPGFGLVIGVYMMSMGVLCLVCLGVEPGHQVQILYIVPGFVPGM